MAPLSADGMKLSAVWDLTASLAAHAVTQERAQEALDVDTVDELVPPEVARHLLKPAVELYLDVHRHPELSGAEERTAGVFAHHLRRVGAEVTTGVGGHGVVGVLANGPGPTVLLRAELDALPLTEDTGLPYASQTDGVAHACGHDLHLAAVAGAASWLAESRREWSGTVLVVGQPAEETLRGAAAMLADGLYTRFGVPDTALAQHTAPLPAGTVAHGLPAQGPLLAGSRTLRVLIHGRGGHAGAPHLTVDPIVAAAAVVQRLQGVVARETAPSEQVVVTVGTLRAGTQANVVPESAELGVSVRARSEAALDRAEAAVERIVRAECEASGCHRKPDVTRTSAGPALLPDGPLSDAVRSVHVRQFGAERVLPWAPAMATEDFAHFAAGEPLTGESGGEYVRTAYWMLGVTSAVRWRTALAGGEPVPSNHSPHFAPDVRTALPTGIAALTGAALHTLREQKL